jgi:sugar phosphate permease
MIRQIHWAWFVFAASFYTTFTYFSIRMGYSILMPEMIVTLKITKAQAGAIASSFFISYTIFCPLLGYLVDRVSARKLLILFSLILAAGTFLMGKPVSLFQACIFFSIVGVGSSAMWVPVATLVQRWFGVKRRGMVMGILGTSPAIGYATMGLIFPPLVAQYDWRICWLILSVLALALVPVHAILVRTKPQDLNLRPWGDEPLPPPGSRSEEIKVKVGFRDLMKIRNLWLGGLSYFFIAFSAYIFNLFLVTYGAMELKLPFASAAKLASVMALSGILGALLLPTFSDSIGRKRSLILINLSFAATILLVIWAGSNWTALLAAICLLGFFYAAIWPLYAAAAADFFPAGATGSVLGFWTLFYGIALIVAPALAGYIADVTGTFIYSFLIASAAGGLAAFFLSGIKGSNDC